MRDAIIKDLSTAIDPKVVADLVGTYEKMVSSFKRGDVDGCLTSSGKFVEHTLRAVEFVRTGAAPAEIKTVQGTVRQIENDTNLPESLRFVVPRVAGSMVYEVRSKRGAVHVKEVDPRYIDASLSVHAASWILSEFLRLYHKSGEAEVASAMAVMMRGEIPLIETFGDERVVTTKVPCPIELLILAVNSADGMDRKAFGLSSKYSAPRVTEGIQKLVEDLFLHQTQDGRYHITGPGERFLAQQLTALGKSSAPIARRV